MSVRNQARLAAVIVASAILVVPSITSAQRSSSRGAGMSAATSAPAHRASATSVHATSKASSRPAISASPRQSPRPANSFASITPNSGFNWEHVNAIDKDLAIKALIDPVTELEVAQAERLLSLNGGAFSGGAYILGGGYYMPTETDEGQQVAEPAQAAESQPAPAPQPQIIVLQQAPAQQAAQPSGNEASAANAEIPDEGQFTLILRDGRQIEAVAFTHMNDKIVYITTDGGRRTIRASDLDADATVRVNEERGTPMQLPL